MNSSELERVAEKLWAKALITTSQVVGCWMYVELARQRSGVEVFFLADTTIHVQYLTVNWCAGLLCRAIKCHEDVKTFSELEETLVHYFGGNNV